MGSESRGMDNRMLVLWTTPCSTSNAFEWMMQRRGDFRCLREPFSVPYYRGADRRTTRFDEDPQDMSVTYASTWQHIQREHRKGRVFTKDFPNYVTHMADEDFLDQFQHTFLIEHPRRALPSMYSYWNTFTMDECSYQALHSMFDAVTGRYGKTPVVIESDDLVEHPHRTVEAYCLAVGIPFLPEALEGDEGEQDRATGKGRGRPRQPQNRAGSQRRSNDYLQIDGVPFLRDMYDRCLPHYEAIARHKM